MKAELREVSAAEMLVYSSFQYDLFLACAACLLVVLLPLALTVARRVRTMPTAKNFKALRWYLRSSMAYLIVNSLEVIAPTAASTLFFMKLCYFFIASIPLWAFFFSLSITGRDAFPRWSALAQWVFPTITALVAFTNELHHLTWGQLVTFKSGPFVVVRALSYGPWVWVVWITMQTAVTVGCVLILISVFTRTRRLDRQSLIIVAGSLAPIVINGTYILRLVPGWHKDFSAPAFAFSGILFAVGVFREHLFDLVPIARRTLVEALADPLVAVDEEGRIVDANPAARMVCGFGSAPGITVSDSPFFASAVALLAEDAVTSAKGGSPVDGKTSAVGGASVELSPDGAHWYEIRSAEVPAGRNRRFKLYVMRDVTESRRLMTEKSALIERLSRALTAIRTLQGIVPICSSCNKIRDDTGYWQQVESYVARHTKVEFSLGLCPSCRARLYPNGDGQREDLLEERHEGGRL